MEGDKNNFSSLNCALNKGDLNRNVLKIERLHQIYLIKKNHITEPNSFKYCFECKKK